MEYVRKGVKIGTFVGAMLMLFITVVVILNFVNLAMGGGGNLMTSSESIYMFNPVYDFVDDEGKASLIINWCCILLFSLCFLICSFSAATAGILAFAYRNDKNKIVKIAIDVVFIVPIVLLMIGYILYFLEYIVFGFIRVFTTTGNDTERVIGIGVFVIGSICFCICCLYSIIIGIGNVVIDVLGVGEQGDFDKGDTQV